MVVNEEKEAKQFKRFLKDNNVYYSFMKNIASVWPTTAFKQHTKQAEIENISPLRFHLKYVTPCQFLQYSFVWRESPEGHEFWEKIDSGWRKFLYEKGYEIVNKTY